MSDPKYRRHYSDSRFWHKVRRYAKTAGRAVLEPALKMYYAARDPSTPKWAKNTIYGALGYLILPADVLPDILPAVGFSDDLGILIAALGVTAAHIKPEHTAKAQQILAKWF